MVINKVEENFGRTARQVKQKNVYILNLMVYYSADLYLFSQSRTDSFCVGVCERDVSSFRCPIDSFNTKKTPPNLPDGFFNQLIL